MIYPEYFLQIIKMKAEYFQCLKIPRECLWTPGLLHVDNPNTPDNSTVKLSDSY